MDFFLFQGLKELSVVSFRGRTGQGKTQEEDERSSYSRGAGGKVKECSVFHCAEGPGLGCFCPKSGAFGRQREVEGYCAIWQSTTAREHASFRRSVPEGSMNRGGLSLTH